ncbi:MAG TPA: hypothetical protein VMC86_03460 [Gemmatimonadales bacterium]|nr:hypothetical protein [Gemmatimonadales bacterium]
MRKAVIGALLVLAAAACDPTTESQVGFTTGGGTGGAGTGVATKLVFTQQPASTQATAAMASAVVVQAEDAAGNVDTTFTATVTLSLFANPDSASLGGNFSVPAIAGIATFSNLTVSKADTGYTLIAASGTLATAISASFTITP